MCGIKKTVTQVQVGSNSQSQMFLILITSLMCPWTIRDPVVTDSNRAAQSVNAHRLLQPCG